MIDMHQKLYLMKTNLLITAIFLITSLNLHAQIRVCTGSTKTYWVDPMDSVAFEWSLKNNCGKIVDGQGSNKISVLWNKESCADSVLLKATGINLCITDQVGLYIQTSALLKANISGSQAVCMHRTTPIHPITVTFTGTPPYSFTYSDGTKDSTVANIPQRQFQFQPQRPILHNSVYQLKQATDSANCQTDSLKGKAVVTVDPNLGSHLQLLTRDTTICPTSPHIAIEMSIIGALPLMIRYQMGGKQDSTTTDKNKFSLPFDLSGSHTIFHINKLQDQNGCLSDPPQAISIYLETLLQSQTITRKKE